MRRTPSSTSATATRCSARSRRTRPDAIVALRGVDRVDACETDPDRAFRVNALGVPQRRRRRRGASARTCVALSTDYVFDGDEGRRRTTSGTRPNPQSVYGASKLGGRVRDRSRAARSCARRGCAARTASNMVKTILRLAASTGSMRFVTDQRGSPDDRRPTSSSRCARSSSTGCPGTWHVTNQGAVTLVRVRPQPCSTAAGDDPGRVEPITTAELDPPRAATRPANSVLDNRALRLAGRPLLPDYRESLDRLVKELLALATGVTHPMRSRRTPVRTGYRRSTMAWANSEVLTSVAPSIRRAKS